MHQESVRKFHEKHGLPTGRRLWQERVPNGDADDSIDRAIRQIELLMRDLNVLMPSALEADAAGDHRLYRLLLTIGELAEKAKALRERNLVLLADALGDIAYCNYGGAVAYGVPLDAVVQEIHNSNMTKTLNLRDQSVRGKGPGYRPPEIEKVLKETGAWYDYEVKTSGNE